LGEETGSSGKQKKPEYMVDTSLASPKKPEHLPETPAANQQERAPGQMRVAAFVNLTPAEDESEEESEIEEIKASQPQPLLAILHGKVVTVVFNGSLELSDDDDDNEEEVDNPQDDDADIRKEVLKLEKAGLPKKIGISGRTLKKALRFLTQEKRTNGAISASLRTYELLEKFIELLCGQSGITPPVRLFWHLIFKEEPDREKDKLRKLVSLLISSSTTDAQVCIATGKLCNKDQFSLQYLLDTPEEEIRDIIRSAGRYKQNSKNMKNLALKVTNQYGGKVPESLEEVAQLPGVFTKIAAIYMKHALDRVVAIPVDVHVESFALFFGWVPKCFEKNREAIRFILEQRFPQTYWPDFNEVIGGLAQIFSVQDHWDYIQNTASHPMFAVDGSGGIFANRITQLALQYNATGRRSNQFDALLAQQGRTQLLMAQARLHPSPAAASAAQTQINVETNRDRVSAAKSALSKATKKHEKAKKLVERTKKRYAKAGKSTAKAKKPAPGKKKPPPNAKKPPPKAKKPPASPLLTQTLLAPLPPSPSPSSDTSPLPSVSSFADIPDLLLQPFRPQCVPNHITTYDLSGSTSEDEDMEDVE
jgi:endonuclease-3